MRPDHGDYEFLAIHPMRVWVCCPFTCTTPASLYWTALADRHTHRQAPAAITGNCHPGRVGRHLCAVFAASTMRGVGSRFPRG